VHHRAQHDIVFLAPGRSRRGTLPILAVGRARRRRAVTLDQRPFGELEDDVRLLLRFDDLQRALPRALRSLFTTQNAVVRLTSRTVSPDDDTPVTAVPEPGTLMLLGSGVLSLITRRARTSPGQ
jgi:hypothetical protein